MDLVVIYSGQILGLHDFPRVPINLHLILKEKCNLPVTNVQHGTLISPGGHKNDLNKNLIQSFTLPFTL